LRCESHHPGEEPGAVAAELAGTNDCLAQGKEGCHPWPEQLVDGFFCPTCGDIKRAVGKIMFLDHDYVRAR